MSLWLVYILLCVAYNYVKIEKRKKRPDYLVANVWRVFFGAVFLIASNPNFDPVGNPFTIIQALPFSVFQVTSFYILFDLLLNLLRGKKWNYKGKASGYLDSLPMWAYYTLKIVCLVGLVNSIIILL